MARNRSQSRFRLERPTWIFHCAANGKSSGTFGARKKKKEKKEKKRKQITAGPHFCRRGRSIRKTRRGKRKRHGKKKEMNLLILRSEINKTKSERNKKEDQLIGPPLFSFVVPPLSSSSSNSFSSSASSFFSYFFLSFILGSFSEWLFSSTVSRNNQCVLAFEKGFFFCPRSDLIRPSFTGFRCD